ncbi:MAG: dihydroneopterin aldolase [Alphaproteobacteria bacterium]|nr:dihydroneopterin aldolase [Alphaproteobacteria bacterium]
MNQPAPVQPLTVQEPAWRTRRIFVRDLVVPCLIGVHRHEKDGRQRVRINLDLDVAEDEAAHGDRLVNVVCYEEIISAIRRITDAGHINLVETLAERVADYCLGDPRVRMARVRIEKLDVFADAGSVGVEIERANRAQ